jgi:hypothetical protein
MKMWLVLGILEETDETWLLESVRGSNHDKASS